MLARPVVGEWNTVGARHDVGQDRPLIFLMLSEHDGSTNRSTMHISVSWCRLKMILIATPGTHGDLRTCQPLATRASSIAVVTTEH